MEAPNGLGVLISMILGDPAHIRNLMYGRKRTEIDWKAVTRRAKSHPADAKDEAPNHRTILHMMVPLHPPLEALKAVIDAYPDALEWTEPYCDRNTNRRLRVDPLGLACHCGASIEIVRMILRAKLAHGTVNGGNIITVTRYCLSGKQKSTIQYRKHCLTLLGFMTSLSHSKY